MVTSISLAFAAFLSFMVGGVHSWLGEARLIGPLTAPATREGLLAKSRFARQVLRFAWHLTTIAWWGSAATLALLALEPIEGQARGVLMAISATFAATAAVTFASSHGRHLAWPVFLAIAGLALAPLV